MKRYLVEFSLPEYKRDILALLLTTTTKEDAENIVKLTFGTDTIIHETLEHEDEVPSTTRAIHEGRFEARFGHHGSTGRKGKRRSH